MPKKKRFRSRFPGGSDDMAVSGPNSRPRVKRPRNGGGFRRPYGEKRNEGAPNANGPEGAVDGAPAVEGEEEQVKEFVGMLKCTQRLWVPEEPGKQLLSRAK